MGVEFVCGLTDWHQSYSGLQEQRRAWLEATVEYLKTLNFVYDPDSNNDEESDRQWFESERNSITEALKRATQPTTMLIGLSHVNYADFEKVDKDTLRSFRLIGLHLFVKHSDCEGSYCPGEALEILTTYKKIEPFMKLHENDKEHYQSFVKVMEESISTGKNVELH